MKTDDALFLFRLEIEGKLSGEQYAEALELIYSFENHHVGFEKMLLLREAGIETKYFRAWMNYMVSRGNRLEVYDEVVALSKTVVSEEIKYDPSKAVNVFSAWIDHMTSRENRLEVFDDLVALSKTLVSEEI